MVYHVAALDPTAEQAHMLAHGARIILQPHQLGCGHEVHLTTTQAQRLAKSHKMGKSAHLRLSEAQLRHHRTHGSGFFSDLVRKVKGAARKAYAVAQPLLAPHAEAIKQRAIQAATNVASHQLGRATNAISARIGKAEQRLSGHQGEGIFDDIMGGIGQVAQAAAPFVPMIAGLGVKPRRQRAVRHAQHAGEGIFDDILGGIGKVAQTVAPIALPLAQTLIQKRFGGGVHKRAPRKAGAGLWN